MQGKYKVITLCGSTRFKDEFMKAQKDLTLAGNIVINVGLFGHSSDHEVWENMDEGTLTKTCWMICINVKLIWLMKFLLSMLVAISALVQSLKLSTQRQLVKQSVILKQWNKISEC